MNMLVVNAIVITNNPEHVTRAMEAFARAATGLGLDGIEVSVRVAPDTDETSNPEPDPEV